MIVPKKVKKSLQAIFDAAPSFDPAKALVIDVANYDENEDNVGEEHFTSAGIPPRR